MDQVLRRDSDLPQAAVHPEVGVRQRRQSGRGDRPEAHEKNQQDPKAGVRRGSESRRAIK